MKEFPQEKYIDLENNPYLLGRVIIYHVRDEFHAEVDIIHRESHKIFKHVDILYQQHSSEEALNSGIQRLRLFLDKTQQAAAPNSKDHLH